MADLGNLVVSLEANMVRFNQNMDEASRRTEQSMNRMQGAVNVAKLAIGALAGAVSVGMLASLVKGAVDAADNLRDMSQQTGIAVEELNGLGFAAGQAGGSLETMVSAAGKLNKSIEDAAKGGKETGEAFKALGIDVIDSSGDLKKADVVMAELADQFAKYRDGPEKVALAMALLGKSGTDMIPLLNDGGAAMRENIEYAKQYSGQTTELSNAADNFNDTMGKLEIQQRGFANAVASQVLPVMQQLADGFLGAAEQSNKFASSSSVIAGSLKVLGSTAYDVTADFKRLGVSIGGFFAIQNGMFSGSLDQMRTAKTAMNAELDAIDQAQGKFKNDLRNGPAPKNPLEQFVQKYSDAADAEQKLLTTRMQMLGKYHNDEGISDKDFNSAKKAAYAEAERNTKTYYDAQIAALIAAKANGLGDPIALQGRIDDLAAKKLLVGADKPAAPRLTSAVTTQKGGKSDAEKALEEGAKLVARLKEQADAYGLTGAAMLEYQMAGKGYSEDQKTQALAHQATIDSLKEEDAAEKKSADNLKKFVEESKRLTDQNTANVEQIRMGLLTEVQAEDEAHAYRLEQLQLFHDTKLENVMLANSLIEEETARHEAVKAEMRMQADQQALGMAGDSASQLYSLMQQAGMEQTALGKALFIANKAIAVAEIIMNTEIGAAKALALGPIVGPPLAFAIRAMGYASAGLTAGMAIASAEGGFDIPAGENPMTQLHEKEMVLPRAQADVIRGLASNGGGGGGKPNFTIVNNGTPQRVLEYREIAPGDWAAIVEDAVNATAAQLGDPNSKTSRSMGRNFNVPRTR
jgi:hypothetical protein